MKNSIASYKEILTEKQFLKMVLANIINRFGDAIDLIAFQWIIYQITGNPVWIAIIGGVNYIPNLLFQPFTGVLIEHMNKRRVMIICDIGRGCITLLMVLLLLMNKLNLWSLLGITFLNSTFESFRLPASISLRTKILDKNKYSIGIALDSSLSRIFELAGFAIAGALVAFSPVVAILLDGITFFLSATIIKFISYSEQINKEKLTVTLYFIRLKEGITYLNSKRIVFYLAIFGATMNIYAIPIVSFQAIYIAESLKLSAVVLSLISIASTLGMGLGAIIAPKLHNRLNGRMIFLITGMCISLVYIILAILPTLRADIILIISYLMIIMLINGIANGIIGVVYNTIFIANIDDEYISRVAGVFGSMTAVSIPLSSFLFAGLSSFLTIPIIFFVSAVICMFIHMSVFIPKEFKKL